MHFWISPSFENNILAEVRYAKNLLNALYFGEIAAFIFLHATRYLGSLSIICINNLFVGLLVGECYRYLNSEQN